jgi:hypothetical protein
MPTVFVAANAHTVVSTGWTNPGNAYVNNTTAATALNGSTTKNITHSGDFGFPAVSTGQIPDGSTIDAVRLVVRGYLSASNITGGTLGIEPHNPAGTAGGSESTTTNATTATDLVSSFSTLPTLANLRTAGQVRARTRGTKGNSSSGLTVYAEYVWMEVDYTAAPVTVSGNFGLDAVLEAETEPTEVLGDFPADAIVLRQETGTLSADAITLRQEILSVPLDTIVLVSVEGQFGADSVFESGSAQDRCVWTSPPDMEVLTDTTPTLAFLPPESVRPQHYEMHLDTNGSFNTLDLYVYRSFPDPSGWEFFDGIDWEPLPPTGLDPSDAGAEIRFTVPIPLSSGSWYRRVRASI